MSGKDCKHGEEYWQHYGVGTWEWNTYTEEYHPIVCHYRACRSCGYIESVIIK